MSNFVHYSRNVLSKVCRIGKNQKFYSESVKKVSINSNDAGEAQTPPAKKKKAPNLGSKEVLNYYGSREDLRLAKENFSANLMRIHRTIPESLYIASTETAKYVAQTIVEDLRGEAPVIEVSPGIGHLTRELLNSGIPKIKLFEPSPYNEPHLNALKNEYPDRISYNICDFFRLWKLAFLDRTDGGNRVQKLFEGMESKTWTQGVSMKIVGATTSLNFIKHLILSVVFQENLIAMGRPELFVAMSPASYYSLVPYDSSAENQVHRPIPVLFDILFEHKVLTKVPRQNYLPWQTDKSATVKLKKKIKLFSLDKEYLYLIRISVKPSPPCKIDQLPLLWYFFKHHLVNRNNRVIPMLEQWIPGCGVWLITAQDPPGTKMATAPDANDAPLPHMTIFTQFRDLSPEQKLTLFKKFVSWPEFEHSPFQETMENHLAKSISTNAFTKDETVEQEDEPIETTLL